MTKPGSIIRRRGHLRVETVYSLSRVYKTYDYTFKRDIPYSSTVSGYIVGRGMWYRAVMTFFSTENHIYYINGNCGVWETDIHNIGDVVFDPVCREKGRIVNFRKMEKAEWLFV
jgi:hypothetical protein